MSPPVFKHPIVVTLWIAVSLAFIKLVGWTPTPGAPASYLMPVLVRVPVATHYTGMGLMIPCFRQAFFTCSMPLMSAAAYVHREPFSRRMRATLGAPDVAFLSEYYALDPAGGFWVYQYEGRIVALIGVDVVRPQRDLESLIELEEVSQREKDRRQTECSEVVGETNAKTTATALTAEKQMARDRKTTKPFSTESNLARFGIIPPTTAPVTASIRHLYVDLPYLRSPLLADMLAHALAHTFGTASSVETVLVEDAVGWPQYRPAFEQAGFRPTSSEGKPAGLLGLAGRDRWLKLDRRTWAARSSS